MYVFVTCELLDWVPELNQVTSRKVTSACFELFLIMHPLQSTYGLFTHIRGEWGGTPWQILMYGCKSNFQRNQIKSFIIYTFLFKPISAISLKRSIIRGSCELTNSLLVQIIYHKNNLSIELATCPLYHIIIPYLFMVKQWYSITLCTIRP